MFQYQTVEPKTLDILRAISSLSVFSEYRLVGGTSLALQYGHRLSIDIALLIEKLGLDQMMGCYHEKYPDGLEMMVLRSLVYFEDAEAQSDPVMLIPYKWESIKRLILDETKKFLK
jgi:hypothetical protein